MPKKKFIKDVGLIGITQILTSLTGFLLLPIITKSLGTYYYGTWAQINVTISLLTPLALMGLSMGFVRFLSSAKEKNTIKEGVYSILFFVFLAGVGLSIILYFGSDLLATFAFKDQTVSYFIKLASFLILLNAIDTIVLFYFRVFRQINRFAYFSIFQSLGKLLFAGLLLWAGYGLFGVIIAFLLIQGLVFIFAMYKIISEIGFVIPKFIYIHEYLNFSLPLTPNSLIRWITDSSDRYLVTYFLGLGSLGIYSAAYSIGWLINLLIAPIQFILYPELSKLYDEGKEEQVKTYLSYSLRYFLMLAIPAVFGLAALAKPLLEILTTENFAAGWAVIPLVALAGLMAGVFQIMINITHLVKQTKMNLYIHILAAIANIGFNIFLIPSIGITGAAISTVLSYVLMILACYHVSSKHLWFDIDYLFILKSFVASLIMYFSIIFLFYPNNIIHLFALIFIGVLIYFVVILLLKGLYNRELDCFRKIYYKTGK